VSGTCFGQPLSRMQGCLAIFLDRRGMTVLVWWGTFIVVGVAAVVVVRVGVGGEVGIHGCGCRFHRHPRRLTIRHYHVLVKWHVRHAKMVLAPTRRVILEGGLWGALVGIPVVSNIVHLMLHGSKIVESCGD
jgi:hypothetical protein